MGSIVGEAVGYAVGAGVGIGVGAGVGATVGSFVGAGVGVLVGAFVGNKVSHTPLVHRLKLQSLLPKHFLPGTQPWQPLLPPQSRSVSS